MYGLVYSNFMDYMRNEGFASSGNSTGAFLLALFGIAFLIVVQLFIVQFLWNTILVKVTTVVKPLPSLLYTLGLLILMAILSPGVAV